MASFPGRNGRRRRVLNDDVLAASSSHVALRALHSDADDDAEDAPRYSERAAVENHPQITDLVPRRLPTVVALGALGIAATAALATLHYFADPVAATLGTESLAPLRLDMAGNVGSWLSAMLLFVSGTVCLIVYSIRRHRLDDYRGQYRVWLAAAAACVLLSANSVAGLHNLLADALTHHSGWTALRGGAVWWLVALGLPFGWLTVRVLVDLKECGLAASLLVTALGCNMAALFGFFGWLPGLDIALEPLVTAAAALLGHWLLLVAIVAYARFVVLDSQGLIPGRRPTLAVRGEPPIRGRRRTQPIAATGEEAERATPSRTAPPAKAPAAVTEWIDGSRPERRSFDDEDDDEVDGGQKLSKSERKRLRKLKARNRAA